VILTWIVMGLCVSWVAFAYLGYALLVWALSRVSPKPVRREVSDSVDRDATCPPASVIIAAYNAERELRTKLEDTLALNYTGTLEVIVASDASSDGTDEIARSFADRGVILSRLPEHRGKEAAQAQAIGVASGEILIFTDVGSRLEADALRHIVGPFADPSVGCVSSEDVVDSEGGEGAYVRYEMWLRRLESKTSTIVGLSGSLFAIRSLLASPWPEELASDFRCALEANRRGFRAICEPAARARFGALNDPKAEWNRKVRTVRRGLAVLSAYRELLHPRFGRVALSVWGHKVARFTAPFALILLLAASAKAAPSSGLAALLFAAQVISYLLAVASLMSPAVARFFPARLAGFFVLVNASILVAWAYHLGGKKAVMWKPTTR
jgi:cellulose synthase/poly-beta-1,6-N-acetylglucosamine synthase-like glycosyltransferase